MCGIVGYSGRRYDSDRKKFIALCREACIRGVHAFGIAYIDEQGDLVVSKSTSFDILMRTIPEKIPSKIMFHNRYATSGDASVSQNNQPISVGNSALVFNGTVDMGTKEEMEQRYGFELSTENDGEIVLRDFLNGEPLKHISTNNVSFAGIYLDRTGKMVALRNEMRPLWRFRDYGGQFITSTRDIALRGGLIAECGTELTPLKLYDL